MPVDPHIGAMLAMLGETGAPPMHEGTPEEGRAAYLQLTQGVRAPEQVVAVASVEDRVVRGRPPGASTGPMSTARSRPQSDGWDITEVKPGWHQWATPSGRRYTKGPRQYPV